MAEQKRQCASQWDVRILVFLAVIIVAGLVFVQRQKKADTAAAPPASSLSSQPAESRRGSADAAEPETRPAGKEAAKKLPRLVDLGAGQCIPCKMMAPILEELKKEYRGKMEVVVIDVWENRTAAREYGIRVIPTQIFYDRQGRELFRHEGFLSKEDILAVWKKLGIEL